MDIVDKTRTRIMGIIMNAMGAHSRFDNHDESGLNLVAPDAILETFQYHEKKDLYIVATTIVVSVQKTLINGQGVSL